MWPIRTFGHGMPCPYPRGPNRSVGAQHAVPACTRPNREGINRNGVTELP